MRTTNRKSYGDYGRSSSASKSKRNSSSLPAQGGYYFGFDSGVSKTAVKQPAKNIRLNIPFLDKIKLPEFLNGKKTLTYVAICCLVIILLVFIGAYAFLNSSAIYTVTLKYKFLNVSDSKVIDATTDGADGFRTVKLEDTDSITSYAPATGQKILGDKASGVVTILNATGEVKVIAKGTVLTCTSGSCSGLTYITQNDANIGPFSSVNGIPIIAGDIGTNYNLTTTNIKFKVGNYSINDVFASNIQAFSGGTAKQILKVVSADDLKNLEAKALEEIKGVLLNKIRNDPANQTKYIISDSSFIAEKVSVDSDPVDKETENVNLTLRAKGTVDAFDKSQIQPVVDEVKSSLAPEGYYIDDKFVNSSSEVVATSPGKISIKVQVNATVRPTIDNDKIKADLKDKSLSEASKYLDNIPHIEGHSETYSPNMMPEWLRRVPSDPNKLIIRLNAEAG